MTDIFRKEFKAITETQLALVKETKEKAEVLMSLYNDLSNDSCIAREIALAKTNLEQSVMWAVKGITT